MHAAMKRQLRLLQRLTLSTVVAVLSSVSISRVTFADGEPQTIQAVARKPGVTIRKSRCLDVAKTSCATSNLAAAFCEADELLVSGGCFFPGENGDDSFPVNTTNRGYPRPLAGLTQAPVKRQTVSGVSVSGVGGSFAADIVAADNGSATMPLGAGWFCQVDAAAGSAAIYPSPCADASECFTGSYWFKVNAYAVCTK